MNKAVFVDRDGTLNEMVYDEIHGTLDSPRRPEDVVLKPHAADFIKCAHRHGYLVIVATNQPGIARGTLSLKALTAVNDKLAARLAAEEAKWDELRFCPHAPGPAPAKNKYAVACECRKPRPGMLLAAARKFDIDLPSSWMLGDGLNDVQAGKNAGCQTMLVTRLKIEQIELFFSLDNCRPDFIVPDLGQAAEIIAEE
ncbi:MAG: HAD-IIIA family hydrolase [Kiritimatiellae bacterium]|jgi:D-glycero-D-manno-heptose 1,7-bisphosphate phosphatase|nr:HAD-IIIA family hydrolase [Kiritimatiellia bacterium]